MTRELLEKRKAELVEQRAAMVVQIHAATGAIAMLDELLHLFADSPPPDTKP